MYVYIYNVLSHNKKELREGKVNNIECCCMLLKKLSNMRTNKCSFLQQSQHWPFGLQKLP